MSSLAHYFKAMGEFKLELQSGNFQLVKISNFLSRVTLKFDGWPWKIIGHLFYIKSNFVHHFKAIGELELKLQSGNAQFRSKLGIFFVLCDPSYKLRSLSHRFLFSQWGPISGKTVFILQGGLGFSLDVQAGMMMSWDGNLFCITGPLWGESTSHRWIPLTKGQ